MSISIKLNNICLNINNISILRNINLELKNKGITLITGHNGAGKSSLLRVMAGFIKPTKGKITYIDHKYNSPVGFVFQKPVMLDRSVNKNLLHALNSNYKNLNNKQSTIDEILDDNNVYHLKNLSAKNISIGEQQIISMLRALIIEPSMLFLDEPTSNLDPQYTKIVENLINNVSNHIKVVLVTQSKHHLSIFNQEIFHLSSGELVD